MKKVTGMALVIIMCVCALSSCAQREKQITVGKASVSEGVYAYFEYTAQKDNPSASSEEQAEKAKTEILKYVATNSKFSDLSLTLTTAQKNQVSENVNNYWHLFGTYYTSIGVSKQDLNKVELNKEYKKAIIRSIYDTNGTSPVPEDAIKAYFSENYVTFKSIIGLFQTTDDDGNVTDISQEKKDQLVSQFTQMKQSIDGGTSFEQVNAAYQSTGGEVEGSAMDTSIISAESHTFPTGTFENIKAIERGASGVFTVGRYIFLVQRENELANESFYKTYRDSCLIGLKSAEFEKTAEEWAAVLE